MANPILTKGSANKVSSPEELNDYIKVSSVGVWIVLSTIVILLISVFVWGATASLQVTVKATGVADNGVVTCYVENASNVQAGEEVRIAGVTGKVVNVSQKPISKESVSEKYDEYTVYCLDPHDWNYEIEVSADGCPDGVYSVTIISDSVKPISFITG